MCAKEDILDGLGKEERSDDCRVSGLLEHGAGGDGPQHTLLWQARVCTVWPAPQLGRSASGGSARARPALESDAWIALSVTLLQWINAGKGDIQ